DYLIDNIIKTLKYYFILNDSDTDYIYSDRDDKQNFHLYFPYIILNKHHASTIRQKLINNIMNNNIFNLLQDIYENIIDNSINKNNTENNTELKLNDYDYSLNIEDYESFNRPKIPIKVQKTIEKTHPDNKIKNIPFDNTPSETFKLDVPEDMIRDLFNNLNVK